MGAATAERIGVGLGLGVGVGVGAGAGAVAVVLVTVHRTVAVVFAFFELATMVKTCPLAVRPVRVTGETHVAAAAPFSEHVVRVAGVFQAILAVVLVVGLVGCVVTVRLGAACRASGWRRSGELEAACRRR
jgi:hypothetical protein